MIYSSVPATEAVFELAEGIIWDERDEVVRWVDINAGLVLAGRLAGDAIAVLSSIPLGQTAGAVALAHDGGQLVAAARGLATISPTGALSFGPDLLGDRTTVRFNDAAVDAFGSVVLGTLTIGADTGDEVLLRVHPSGEVDVLREGVRLSNGLAFSPDGRTIYHVDSYAKTVSRHSYGPGAFDVDEPWTIVIDESTRPPYPDGLVVDSEGMLWLAMFGGSSVRRYTPTGEIVDMVIVDAEQVTCPGFVGPRLDRLAITSGREGGTFSDQTGAIFLADPGATGLPEHRWAGSTTAPYWLPADRS